MKKLVWILIALVFWLAFVIVQAPATWAAWLMTRDNDNLALSGLSGGLWQGRAGLASVSIDGEHFSLGEVRWRVEPFSLLRLRPCADLSTHLERQQLEAHACASLDGEVTLRDGQVSLPASTIRDLPVKLDGQLSGRIRELRLADNRLQTVDGNISWTRARIHDGESWIDIGSLAGEVSERDAEHIEVQLFDLDSPVELDVTATFALAGGIHLAGEVALENAFSRRIQADQWLPVMAESLGENRYRLDMDL